MEAYEQLEGVWAEFNGLDPAGMVACSSGTAALHLAVEGLGLANRMLTVGVPDYTMVACARAVRLANAHVEFLDCGPDLLVSPASLVGRNGRYAAVMPLHVYGRRCNLDALQATLRSQQFILPGGQVPHVIEDLAEAHLVRPHPDTSAACWSFYKNKLVAGEEGGAVWFKDPAHAAQARKLRCLGFTDAHDYTHVPRGHNYRLANCLASLVLSSLEGVQESARRRNESIANYDEVCPADWRSGPRQSPWVYDLRVPGMTRGQQDRAVTLLRRAGVPARRGFKPLRRQEEFDNGRNTPLEITESDRAAREVIYLPCYNHWVVPRSEARTCMGVIEMALQLP